MPSTPWPTFVVWTLEPFLSCRDWVALSWCCRHVGQDVNLQRTLLPKLRRALQQHWQEDDPPSVFAGLWSRFQRYQGLMTGNSLLYRFMGWSHYEDLPIYYEDGPLVFRPETSDGEGVLVSYRSGEDVAPVRTHFTTDYVAAQSGRMYSWVNLDAEQDIEDPPLEELLTSPSDHVRNLVWSSEPVAWSKIALTPSALHIHDLSALIYGEANWTLPTSSESAEAWQQAYAAVNHYEACCGLRVLNRARIDQEILVHQVLALYQTYQEYWKVSNSTIDQERVLVQRWLDSKPAVTEVALPRQDHFWNRRYAPLTPWIQTYHLPPYAVYLSLCYGQHTDLLSALFDVRRIPWRWLEGRWSTYRHYLDAFLERDDLADPRVQQRVWELVMCHWPRPLVQ